jgi:hypothetical protein
MRSSLLRSIGQPKRIALLVVAIFLGWDAYLSASRTSDSPAVNWSILVIALAFQVLGAVAAISLSLPPNSKLCEFLGVFFQRRVVIPLLLGSLLGGVAALHALHFGNCSRIGFGTAGACQVLAPSN